MWLEGQGTGIIIVRVRFFSKHGSLLFKVGGREKRGLSEVSESEGDAFKCRNLLRLWQNAARRIGGRQPSKASSSANAAQSL